MQTTDPYYKEWLAEAEATFEKALIDVEALDEKRALAALCDAVTSARPAVVIDLPNARIRRSLKRKFDAADLQATIRGDQLCISLKKADSNDIAEAFRLHTVKSANERYDSIIESIDYVGRSVESINGYLEDVSKSVDDVAVAITDATDEKQADTTTNKRQRVK